MWGAVRGGEVWEGRPVPAKSCISVCALPRAGGHSPPRALSCIRTDVHRVVSPHSPSCPPPEDMGAPTPRRRVYLCWGGAGEQEEGSAPCLQPPRRACCVSTRGARLSEGMVEGHGTLPSALTTRASWDVTERSRKRKKETSEHAEWLAELTPEADEPFFLQGARGGG